MVLRISSVFLCTSSLVSPTPPVLPVSLAPSINWDITSMKEPRDNNDTTWLRGEGKRGKRREEERREEERREEERREEERREEERREEERREEERREEERREEERRRGEEERRGGR